jgi:hypothetical protein
MANKPHVKIAPKLWARSTEQWIKDQGNDPVEMFWILQRARSREGQIVPAVLEGFINKKTGKRIISCLRKANEEDIKKERARRAAKAAKNPGLLQS